MLYQRKSNIVEAIQINSTKDIDILLSMIKRYIVEISIEIYSISEENQIDDFIVKFKDVIKGEQEIHKGEWLIIEDEPSNYINTKSLQVYDSYTFKEKFEEVNNNGQLAIPR